MPQYSFQVPSRPNVFEGLSQGLCTTLNTLPSAYNAPTSTLYYRPSLPNEMHDMGDDHVDEYGHNNNTNNNNDADDGQGTEHVGEQQQPISCHHPRTRGGRTRTR